MTAEIKHLLCVGLGYSASALARRLAPSGCRVTGTSRTCAGVAALQTQGFSALRFDGTVPEPALAEALQTATHLLISSPPGTAGDPLLRHHARDLTAALHLTWIGYLSTIGVYGDHGGAWVDEDTAPTPLSARSKERLAAETAWGDFAQATGKQVQIFRLPGIYGPGRSVVDDLKEGTARRIVKAGQVFNRVHVADIAQVLEAAMRHPHAAPLYNVADNEPASSADVIAYAAALMGLPVPPALPFETSELSPMARSFYSECKRVKNTRLIRDLNITLAYPTYREGLAQVLALLPPVQ